MQLSIENQMNERLLKLVPVAYVNELLSRYNAENVDVEEKYSKVRDLYPTLYALFKLFPLINYDPVEMMMVSHMIYSRKGSFSSIMLFAKYINSSIISYRLDYSYGKPPYVKFLKAGCSDLRQFRDLFNVLFRELLFVQNTGADVMDSVYVFWVEATITNAMAVVHETDFATYSEIGYDNYGYKDGEIRR